MSRYETLLDRAGTTLRGIETPADIERLAEPLVRLNLDEAEVARAYKICGVCDSRYTEAQWANLAPAPGRLWTWDAFTQEEWRECNGCFAPLTVLVRNGRQRPAGTLPFKSVADAVHPCGWCMRTIKPGQRYVERLEKRNGMRAVGRWAFCCSECEAA